MFYAGKVNHYGLVFHGRRVEDERISSAFVYAFPKKAQRDEFLRIHPECEVIPYKMAKWIRDNEWKADTFGYHITLNYMDATIPEYWEEADYEAMLKTGLFDVA